LVVAFLESGEEVKNPFQIFLDEFLIRNSEGAYIGLTVILKTKIFLLGLITERGFLTKFPLDPFPREPESLPGS